MSSDSVLRSVPYRQTFPDLSWGDVTTDGRVIALHRLPADAWQVVEVPLVGSLLPLTSCPERLMFLRADSHGSHLCVTGQGHQSGTWWLWTGGPWMPLGPVGGAHCVEVIGTPQGWDVYGQVTSTRYHILSVDVFGSIFRRQEHEMPATSQGFLDVATYGLLFTDGAFRIGDVMKPVGAGGMLVGQHAEDPPRAILCDREGLPMRLLHNGPAESVRASWDGVALTVYVMGTWEGTRLSGTIESFPIFEPPLPEEWLPTGTLVRTAPFFDIPVRTIPRTAADGQCWQAHRGEEQLRIVKGGIPHLCEVLAFTPHGLALAYDATDGRFPRAWRLDLKGDGRSDAPWCPWETVIGAIVPYREATLLRRSTDGVAPSTEEPFPYAVGVEKVGRHIDYGRDVGVVDEVLVHRYVPQWGRSGDGYYELAHWAIKSGIAIGLVRYEEFRSGSLARQFSFVTSAPDRHVPATALQVLDIPSITVPPSQEPMSAPKVNIAEFAPVLRAGVNARIVRVQNGNASDVVTVSLENDSLHVEWQNSGGYDRSAKRREVRIAGAATPTPDPQPDPQPHPDPDPTDPLRPVLPPLRIEGKHFTRNGRHTLPWYIHGGDLISRAARDWDGAMALLNEASILGADGVRMWTYLLGLPFWTGRTYTPGWPHVARVVEACQRRGLQVLLSQGDVWQLGASAARSALQQVADFIRTHDPDAFDVVDGGNELWQNPGVAPEVIASACGVLANIGPLVLLTDAPEGGPYPPGDEGKDLYRQHMARWRQYPASCLALHSQFSDPDGCIRRTWNGGYETGAWLRFEDETRGPGRNVSVCNNVSPSQMLCLMAASWISGGAPVALCSAGVISDGMKNGHFDGGEHFIDQPGFARINELRNWLPADVMGWRRVHGGYRDGSPRIFATHAEDETRADHAINEATGEYVCVISGESRRGVTRVRTASEEDFPGLTDDYRIVKGRLA